MLESVSLTQVRPRSLVDDATDQLRRSIIDGEHQPDARLTERLLADALGISTVAVREALLRLESEGLVYRLPRRGVFVRPVTAERVRDLARVRIALEQLAVELAMGRWTTDLQHEAQSAVDRMGQVDVSLGYSEIRDLDREFHRIFLRAAQSETLDSAMSAMDARISLYMNYGARTIDAQRLTDIVNIHQVWLDAAATGNVRNARKVVEAHITSSCNSIVAAFVVDREPERLIRGR